MGSKKEIVQLARTVLPITQKIQNTERNMFF